MKSVCHFSAWLTPGMADNITGRPGHLRNRFLSKTAVEEDEMDVEVDVAADWLCLLLRQE